MDSTWTVAEWNQLADRVGAPPFLRPGWFSAWSSAFGNGEITVLTARRDGRLVGVIPMIRRGGSLNAPVNHHSPGFAAIAVDDEAVRELASNLVSAAPRRICVGLLAEDEAMFARCEDAARAAGWRILVRPQRQTPFVSLTGDWEAQLAQLTRKFRKELRRVRRRLEELGAVTFDVFQGGRQLEERLDEVVAVENTGWKRERGTAIASRSDTRTFYLKLARWAAEHGYLRLFALRLNGAAIAVDYCLEDRGVRYMLKGGFDPQYASCSPGNLLLEEVLAHAARTGIDEVELGGTVDRYKLRWTSTTRNRKLLQVFAPTLAGRIDWSAVYYGHPLAKRMLSALQPSTHNRRKPVPSI